MKVGPVFSVICATLFRPSYMSFVLSLRAQQFRSDRFEYIGRGDSGTGVNEYVARNRAAKEAKGEFLVFRDDDTVLPSGHLRLLAEALDRHPEAEAVGGPLRGNMWGQGIMEVNQPEWGIGANMAIRRDVFEELGGFEENWGLDHTPRGWRADTDMWWRLDARGPKSCLWVNELVVEHPGPMGSVWQPDVEQVFFRRWRERCLKEFVPVDPRLGQFLLETEPLSDEERALVLKARAAFRKTMPDLPVLSAEKEPIS
jgi:hypothetical protein